MPAAARASIRSAACIVAPARTNPPHDYSTIPQHTMRKLTPDDLCAMLERAPAADGVELLRALADWMRPQQPRNVAPLLGRIEQLGLALEERPELRAQVADALWSVLAGARHLPLYTELGLPSRRGFARELIDRGYDRLNPRPVDRADLRDVLALVFHAPDDADWVCALPDDTWLRLFALLTGDAAGDHRTGVRRARDEVIYAIEMLGVWIAAEELEPELLRLDPRIAERQSAFVALQRELSDFVHDYAHWVHDRSGPYHDDRHAQVLLEQCFEQIARLRRRAVEYGSTMALTHLLVRLERTLERLTALLELIDPEDPMRRRGSGVRLFKALVVANDRRHQLGAVWQDGVALLARSVTEQASRTGEHYVTRTRAEYLHMLRAAGGAGVVIALLALYKLDLSMRGFAPLPQALLASLNYGCGFVLIHLLGCTVATKQPAMTAARIAADIERGERGGANPDRLAGLLLDVGRSQFIAVVGNVGVALPLALVIGWCWAAWDGAALLSPATAAYELRALLPLAGLALPHAANAGVWLFVAGLVAGYFDNRCAYLDLPGRLAAHPLLLRLPGSWRHRISDYIAQNYGALAGNFTFGVLLGMTAYAGHLLALPLDIRHVAFSSANLGYVLSSTPLAPLAMFGYLACIALIAVVNLAVSFGLASYVALRARGSRIESWPALVAAYVERLSEAPTLLLLPPPDPPTERPDETP